MSELREITRLSDEQGADLQAAALSGDAAAARRFVLWAAWRRIKKQPPYSMRAKIEAFSYVIQKARIEVEVVPPSSLPPDPASHPMNEAPETVTDGR